MKITHYSAEKSYISFEAPGYVVYLKGYGLEQLFLDLYSQLTLEIKCLDPRYVDEENPPKVGVTEISVVSAKWKKKKATDNDSSNKENRD